MKTRNDLLAEYVREKYPEIELSLDFAFYCFINSAKEFDETLKNMFKTIPVSEIERYYDEQHKSD